MKLFLRLSLIVTAIFYLAASIYSASFIPFNWQTRGVIVIAWVLSLLVCALIPVAIYLDERDKNDQK